MEAQEKLTAETPSHEMAHHRTWLTHAKAHNLFRVDENSLEQCCAAHIVSTTLFGIVTPDCGLIQAQQC